MQKMNNWGLILLATLAGVVVGRHAPILIDCLLGFVFLATRSIFETLFYFIKPIMYTIVWSVDLLNSGEGVGPLIQ